MAYLLNKNTMSKIVKKKDLDVLIESTLKKAGIEKSLVNEEMVGPVNYDDQIAAELKAEVGNLDKLTPYVLAKGDGKMDVQMGADGKVHLTDVSTKKKVGLYKNVDDFLRGIGYQMKMESTSSKKPLINEEKETGEKYTKVLEKNFSGDWSTPQNENNKLAVKNFFKKLKKGEVNFDEYFESDGTLKISKKDFVNEFKPKEVKESKSSDKSLIKEDLEKFNKLINYTFKK